MKLGMVHGLFNDLNKGQTAAVFLLVAEVFTGVIASDKNVFNKVFISGDEPAIEQVFCFACRDKRLRLVKHPKVSHVPFSYS